MIRDHDRVNRTALSGCIDETSRRRMGAPSASIPEAVLANLARACDAYFSVSSHAKPHEGGDMGDVRDLTAASYPGLDIMAASVHPSCLRSMRGLMGVFCSRLAVAKQRATGEGGGGKTHTKQRIPKSTVHACPLSSPCPKFPQTVCQHSSQSVRTPRTRSPTAPPSCHKWTTPATVRYRYRYGECRSTAALSLTSDVLLATGNGGPRG